MWQLPTQHVDNILNYIELTIDIQYINLVGELRAICCILAKIRRVITGLYCITRWANIIVMCKVSRDCLLHTIARYRYTTPFHSMGRPAFPPHYNTERERRRPHRIKMRCISITSDWAASSTKYPHCPHTLPGTVSLTVSPIEIQIRQTFCFLILMLKEWSLQNFAHVTTNMCNNF